MLDGSDREEFEAAYEMIATVVNEVIAENSLSASMTLNVLSTILGRLTALAAKDVTSAQKLLERVVLIVSQACAIESKDLDEEDDDDSLSNQL